jgi:hypothetical protein
VRLTLHSNNHQTLNHLTQLLSPNFDVDPNFFRTGADDEIRTRDLLITNQLLYQLSYVGVYLPAREM